MGKDKGKTKAYVCLLAALCVLAAAGTGCGKAGSAQGQDAGQTSGAAQVSAEKDAEEKDGAEKDGAEKDTAAEGTEETLQTAEGKKPALYTQLRSHSVWSERTDDLKYLDFSYETLFPGEETEADYPALAKALSAHEKELREGKENAYKALLDSAKDTEKDAEGRGLPSYELPFTEEDRLYVRRADAQVVSVLERDMYAGQMSDSYYEYTTHTYDTATGSELGISDVVKDKETFCKLVADRLNDALAREAERWIEGGFTPDTEYTLTLVEKEFSKNTLSWTCDPQGVTVYFGSYKFLPYPVQATVLYAEEEALALWNAAYLPGDTSSWVMYLPLYDETGFDAEDDGVTDTLALYVNSDEWGEVEELMVQLNDTTATFDMGLAYDLQPFLVRQGGETWLWLRYAAFDRACVDVYALSGGRIKNTESMAADFDARFPADDIDWENGERMPVPVFTAPEEFALVTYTDLLSTVQGRRTYAFRGGRLTPADDVYTLFTHEEEGGFRLTLSLNTLEAPLVDKETLTETGESRTLKKGDALRLLYTDNETYTDCALEDGSLVRIYVEEDEAQGRCVDGVPIFDVFDGILLAG